MFPCLSRQYINSHYSSPFYDIQRILRHHPIGLIFPYQLPLYIEINFDDIFSPFLIFLKIYFKKTLIYSFIYTFVINVNNGMLVTCKCHLQMFYKLKKNATDENRVQMCICSFNDVEGGGGKGRRVTILTESEGVRNRGNLFRSEVSLLHILFFK